MNLPFLRKTEAGEPLVVAMTGIRLGDRAIFSGSDADLLLPLAARVGLSGRLLVVCPAAAALQARAEREGLLVESADAPPGEAGFDLAVVQAEDDWSGDLASLLTAVRPGGRLVVIAGQRASGLLSRFGRRASSAPDAAGIVDGLVRAGWTRARSIGDREGLTFVEAVRP